MRAYLWIHSAWGLGWGRKRRIENPSLSFTNAAAGWTGTATLTDSQPISVGDEIAVYVDDALVWLGKVIRTVFSSTSQQYVAEARGLTEDFLDLPAEIGYKTISGRAVLYLSDLWKYDLKYMVQSHTWRFLTAVSDAFTATGQWTPDFVGKTVGDVWRWYKAQYPVRIVPQADSGGRITFTLDTYPNSVYNTIGAEYEREEDIRSFASRIIMEPADTQLLPQRNFEQTLDAENTHWKIVPPASGSYSVSIPPPEFPSQAYVGMRAVKVQMDSGFTTGSWVGLETRDKVKIVRGKTYAVGVYARGTNAKLRILVNGVAGAERTLAGYWDEYADSVVVNTADDAAIRFEVQPVNLAQPATVWLDMPYMKLFPNTISPLYERAQTGYRLGADDVFRLYSPHIIGRAADISQDIGTSYYLTATNHSFSAGLVGKTIEVYDANNRLFGTIDSVIDAETLYVTFPSGSPTPHPFSEFRIYAPSITGADEDAEKKYGVAYAVADTSAERVTSDEMLLFLSKPQVRCTFGIAQPARLAEVGEIVYDPQTGNELRIVEVGVEIFHGRVTGLRLVAGAPEPTLRSYFRNLQPVRRFTR